MSNKILRNIILAGLFAVPFVPFIVSSSLFFPFITGKAFIFRLVVEIVFACYLILALRDPSVRPKFSWILGALLSFLIVMGLADIFAINSFKAFWSNYERMEGYVTLLHLGAYFLVMSSVLKSESLWNRLLSTTLGASALMSIYSFFQLAGKITINQGGVRVDGTLGNAAYLGVYMLFHLFIAALLFSRFKEKWQRGLIGIVALMNLVVLYYTATRGAILGLLGGAVITFLFLLFKDKSAQGGPASGGVAAVRKVALGGLLGLVVFVGLFIAVKDNSLVRENPVLSRFASLSFEEIKTQGRYYVWPMAWKGFLERPVLGWGQEGFNFVFNKYYVPEMWSQEPWFDRAHSTPLDWLIAGGALGALTYLSIFAMAAYYLFRSDEHLSQKEKAIILGLLSGYFFNNLFVFDQIGSYILFFLVLAYLHSHAPESKFSLWDKVATKLESKLGTGQKPVAEALIVIAVVVASYFSVYAPWQQNKDLLAVLALSNQGKIGEIADYKKPLRSGTGFAESLEYVSQTAAAIANSDAPMEFKQQLFQVVDESFQKHIAKVPTDLRYRLFYSGFLSKYGWYGKALEQLEVAKELSPKKQQIYFEIASNSLSDGKPEQAVEAARVAYELDPSYTEAKYVYGLTLTAANDPKASELLSDFSEEKIIFDDRYLNSLLIAGRADEIVKLAIKRVELEPDNYQHRVTLTAAYLQSNRRAEAIQTLEELIRINPSFKEQGEYYISEIRAGRNP